jgi:hypothetical protein
MGFGDLCFLTIASSLQQKQNPREMREYMQVEVPLLEHISD